MKNVYQKLADCIIMRGAVKATAYISDNHTIKFTRKRWGNKVIKGNTEICVTDGKPNYLERKFIKLCKKSGESFPIKKIQIKFTK